MKERKVAQVTAGILGLVMALGTVPAMARTVGITADAGTMGFGVNVGTEIIQNTLDIRTGSGRDIPISGCLDLTRFGGQFLTSLSVL
ncbi:MAG: hypothetical protein ACYCXT_03940 [Acidiferrobacteraceae bacterium]